MRPDDPADAVFTPGTGAAPGGVEGDDRRTRIGRFMRKTSFDELLQLINVVRGDMSLVTPRPERPESVELIDIQIRRYGQRHRVKAGMTGRAQVHGLRGQTSIADRAEFDNFYIENWPLLLDFKILIPTVRPCCVSPKTDTAAITPGIRRSEAASGPCRIHDQTSCSRAGSPDRRSGDRNSG